MTAPRKVYRVVLGLDVVVSGPKSKQQARVAAVLAVSTLLGHEFTVQLDDGRSALVRLWTRDDPDGRPLPPLDGVHDYSAYLLGTEEEITNAG